MFVGATYTSPLANIVPKNNEKIKIYQLRFLDDG